MDNYNRETTASQPSSPENFYSKLKEKGRGMILKPFKVRRPSMGSAVFEDTPDEVVPSEVTKEDESARVAVSRKIVSKRTITLTPSSNSKVGPLLERLGYQTEEKSRDKPTLELYSPQRNVGSSTQMRTPSKTIAHIIGPRLQTDRLKTVSLAEDLESCHPNSNFPKNRPSSNFFLKKESSIVGAITKKASLKFDHKADTEIVSEHEFQILEGGVKRTVKLVTFANGSVFEGEMKDGILHGKGYFRHPSGYSIKGTFEANKIKGTAEYVSGSTSYIGEWMNSVPHGRGKETVIGCYTYDGDFYHGVKSGRGKWTIEGKGWYDGEVRDNCFCGRGNFCWNDGKMYIGLWRDGKRHGKGKVIWPDGRIFEGNYVNNKKEGVGHFKWADGRIYLGPWKRGQQDGKGKYLTLFGDKCEAKWTKGELQIDIPSPSLPPSSNKLKV
jgi:hypothetical protein